MRIAYVVQWFLPRHTAGTEVYTYQLASALASQHEVSIYCREEGHSEGGFHEEADEYGGLPVHRVYYNPPAGPLRPLAKAVARFHNPTIAASFARYLRSLRPDVVHFHHLVKLSGSLIGVAQELGIPTVVTLHDYWFLCHNGQLLRPGEVVCAGPAGGWRCGACAEVPGGAIMQRALAPFIAPLMAYRTRTLRRALERADAIISPSAYLADVFVRHGLPRERVLVNDNGIDLSWRPLVRRRRRVTLRVGYIGTLARHKGVHLLVAAFRDLGLSNVALDIYGDPETDPVYTAELQRLAFGQRVRFVGPFPHEEIARVLSAIDLLVVPSLWPENSPLAIHEARAARVPVLAADIGGMTELVQEGLAGWLFRASDLSDLRQQLHWILTHPERLAQVRRQMRPVKSIAENAVELMALYERLIAARR